MSKPNTIAYDINKSFKENIMSVFKETQGDHIQRELGRELQDGDITVVGIRSNTDNRLEKKNTIITLAGNRYFDTGNPAHLKVSRETDIYYDRINLIGQGVVKSDRLEIGSLNDVIIIQGAIGTASSTSDQINLIKRTLTSLGLGSIRTTPSNEEELGWHFEELRATTNDNVKELRIRLLENNKIYIIDKQPTEALPSFVFDVSIYIRGNS